MVLKWNKDSYLIQTLSDHPPRYLEKNNQYEIIIFNNKPSISNYKLKVKNEKIKYIPIDF